MVRRQTVVETPAFLSAAKGVLSEQERKALVDLLASHPQSGASLGGGIRKLRIPRAGRGKSGGARVVFLFADESLPIFLLTVFAKNEKANLTQSEQARLISMAKQMITSYRSRK
ncbi:type II toxin-antitoxin system RelE/ParE family toxin [Fodinicurvata halophila]|uniref:Type II toxin-antitoxin system RelE/ParE family toxin n=1 Tax=Fodinicurvata halophila TaxID=1419723 RepID=A0ABV8UJ38_9PROT